MSKSQSNNRDHCTISHRLVVQVWFDKLVPHICSFALVKACQVIANLVDGVQNDVHLAKGCA